MIQEFVERFNLKRGVLLAGFQQAHPETYLDVVRAVISVLHDPDVYNSIDPERIVAIDHGSYQGTLVYVIGESGYQPDRYWYVRVGYGSCSGCDTLDGIRYLTEEPPTQQQAGDYMTLALHIVQGLRAMGGEVV